MISPISPIAAPTRSDAPELSVRQAGGVLESLRQTPGKTAGPGNLSYAADITLPANRELIDTELREGLFQPRPTTSLFTPPAHLTPQSMGRPLEEILNAANRWEDRNRTSQSLTGPAARYAEVHSGGTPRLGLSVYA